MKQLDVAPIDSKLKGMTALVVESCLAQRKRNSHWLGSGQDEGYPNYDPYVDCIESISQTDFSVALVFAKEVFWCYLIVSSLWLHDLAWFQRI